MKAEYSTSRSFCVAMLRPSQAGAGGCDWPSSDMSAELDGGLAAMPYGCCANGFTLAATRRAVRGGGGGG